MEGRAMSTPCVNEKWSWMRVVPAGFGSLFYRLEMQERDICIVEPDDIEEPFRTMLVHSQDMTPTLEHSAGSRIGLVVLCREISGNVLLRQVLLLAEELDRTPLVLGNIEIGLNHLPEHARELVMDGVIPFGAILRQEQIDHWNSPGEFFRLRLSAPLSKHFDAAFGQITYGRSRIITDRNEAILAQVMEILSPRYASVVKTKSFYGSSSID